MWHARPCIDTRILSGLVFITKIYINVLNPNPPNGNFSPLDKSANWSWVIFGVVLFSFAIVGVILAVLYKFWGTRIGRKGSKSGRRFWKKGTINKKNMAKNKKKINKRNRNNRKMLLIIRRRWALQWDPSRQRGEQSRARRPRIRVHCAGFEAGKGRRRKSTSVGGKDIRWKELLQHGRPQGSRIYEKWGAEVGEFLAIERLRELQSGWRWILETDVVSPTRAKTISLFCLFTYFLRFWFFPFLSM